jgi:hypothetical protein
MIVYVLLERWIYEIFSFLSFLMDTVDDRSIDVTEISFLEKIPLVAKWINDVGTVIANS